MTRIAAVAAFASFLALGVGCGGTTNNMDAGTSLYDKYGGAPTIKKVVDDAVTGLLADATEAPYFTHNVKDLSGSASDDSVVRLKSCLRLQFTVLFGGPGQYPGVNDNGDTCVTMAAIHTGVGIPGTVFDKFIMDLSSVLTADGVSTADINSIAPTLTGMKSQVTSSTPVCYSADGGTFTSGCM